MTSDTKRNNKNKDINESTYSPSPEYGTDQHRASNPMESVWVSASAGTGKTKVLTDRLLRLLLPKSDGSPGAEPHKILCVTFTKSAANEMTLRLFEKLSQWAVMPIDRSPRDKDSSPCLTSELSDLMGATASRSQIEAAGQLFSKILDSHSGLRILTLHSFCQSVLRRFPLEAYVPPHFSVLEEADSRDLIREAQRLVFESASSREQGGSPLQNAMLTLTSQQNEEQFVDLLSQTSAERTQLKSLKRRFRDIDSVYEAMCQHFNVLPGQSVEAYLNEAIFRDAEAEERLKKVCLFLLEGGQTERGKGQKILDWFATPRDARIRSYYDYQNIFLNSEGALYTKGFPSAKTKKHCPYAEEVLREEGQEILRIAEVIKKISCIGWTRALMILTDAVITTYENLKRSKGVLDYDDLIMKTFDLITGQTLKIRLFQDNEGESDIEVTPWIMYKLDQGLDHLLVDEAQDTNPEQWKIIEALTDDFFSGHGAVKTRRTCFTVGDIKQSIYSFQRAAPDAFVHTREVFKDKVRRTGQEMLQVPLRRSFRTSPPILALVDAVFDRNDLRSALGGEIVEHISHRQGQAGRIELWPVIEGKKRDKPDVWEVPVSAQNVQNPSAVLSQVIADEIQSLIESPEILEPYGRSVQPGDILILVRTRISLVDEVIRALKLRRIPVSGADRMNLTTQLTIQDLLAAAKFCLLPTDDLNLACLLKSPLIGWGEEELFSLAVERKGDLWSELVHFGARTYHRLLDDVHGLGVEKVEESVTYLRRLLSFSRQAGVYEFFSFVLHSPCPGCPQSGIMAIKKRLGEDAADPIEEFLNEALGFRRFHIDALQLFVEYFEGGSKEIKREMAEGVGPVRIMTVHGSKGLQAPIVILPDTAGSSQRGRESKLLWPDKTGMDFPLWFPRCDDAPEEFLSLYERAKFKQEEESNRLLYVAMTRAADRLYVCGFKGWRSGSEESWYDKIRKGFEKIEGVCADDRGRLVYSEPQSEAPDKIKAALPVPNEVKLVPGWIFDSAPLEPDPPRPLVPSRAKQEEDNFPVLSPLEAGQGLRFLRGNLTHKLLQFLPTFALERRAEGARTYVETYGVDLTEEQRESIVCEVLALMTDPVTAPFFEAGGLAEVPLTALLEGNRILSGQIDRLVVREDGVWILDYKTNRPPPPEVSGVPRIYLKQMRAYRDAVKAIYPAKTVISALLWTDGPRLMILPDPELDKVI